MTIKSLIINLWFNVDSYTRNSNYIHIKISNYIHDVHQVNIEALLWQQIYDVDKYISLC